MTRGSAGSQNGAHTGVAISLDEICAVDAPPGEPGFVVEVTVHAATRIASVPKVKMRLCMPRGLEGAARSVTEIVRTVRMGRIGRRSR